MKRFLIYVCIIASMCALFGWGMWRTYKAFKASIAVTSCTCNISPLSSDQATQSLSTFLEKELIEKKQSLASVARALQQAFPHCVAFSCRQQPSGLVQARIEIGEPLCAVNDDALLTVQGVVVSKTAYADDAVIGLPKLSMDNVQSGSFLSSQLLSFLHKIPATVLATHGIVYHSDDEIVITPLQRSDAYNVLQVMQGEKAQKDALLKMRAQQDMSNPDYVCAVDTVFDADLLAKCNLVCADLEQQMITKKKKTRTAWVLDVRFDKQIILYPHMGGQVHG